MISPIGFSHRLSQRRGRGFALVIVLAAMVLLIVLIIGFLAQVGTERTAAGGFHSSVMTRQLADTAVSMVQGQINMATTQGPSIAWTSQPGMVRTFDATGMLKAFKLYSAKDMIASTVSLTADLPPADWGSSPALWTDLNAPVEVAGEKHFPILDPTGIGLSSSAVGLSVTSAPGATTASYQPAPMPVRWLYVLRDGKMVMPTNVVGETATIPDASDDNPIVGRIAFWTDDETCKVNVNTASEGTFWDTPRAYTEQEKAYGNFQPAQREFQRYPGHPAMVSLSAVFPNLTPTQIYDITPRVIGGGSEAGTQIAPNALTPDADRLYANLDELMFAASRDENAGLTKPMIERAKFTLTAHSRAPEVNLYNLPRVAAWPIFKFTNSTGTPDPGRTTAFDRLIAFCSSTGKIGETSYHPYIFQRENSLSTTNDISLLRNEELYEYLQHLTRQAVPGYGGNFFTKYGNDRDQILTEIFDYIRSTNLYDDNLAAGSQFTAGRVDASTATTKSHGFSQIGHGWVVPSVKGSTKGFGRSLTVSELGIGFICNASGDFLSSNDPANNLLLDGSALGANERSVQAIIVPEFFSPSQGYTVMRPDMTLEISGLDQLSVTVAGQTKALFPGLVSATTRYSGEPRMVENGRRIGGVFDWRYAFTTSVQPNNVNNVENRSKGAPLRGASPADSDADLYPFIGSPVKITAANDAATMTFNGANLTLKLYVGASTDVIQTITINIPNGVFPVPKLAKNTPELAGTTMQTWWTFAKEKKATGSNGRLYRALNKPGTDGQILRTDIDVVRTVIPSHGDYRLVAGQSNVPASVFVKHRLYDTVVARFASNLGGYGPYQGFDPSTYFQGISYGGTAIPDTNAAAVLSERPESTGDVDSGLTQFTDGAYINKPDEGSTYRDATGVIPYFNVSMHDSAGQTFFSPNRQIPSPGMFGSLPTGVKAGVPWQTLLFRPQATHPGAASPKDSLIMDLFWMPVVEPYAISDRFSTAGKVNMNYQILPFTYINRATAWHALLKAEMLTVIPDSVSATYKNSASFSTNNFRLKLDIDQTLQQFKTHFDAGKVYLSSSDICDLWMVPAGTALGSMSTYWNNKRLTGDNLRERIYTTLYPRVTTKSNTFTVHFRVQALRKQKTSSTNLATVWTEGRDAVVGEYRGSTTIERFINADNPEIPDYAAEVGNISDLPTLDSFYKWRVIANRQFAP